MIFLYEHSRSTPTGLTHLLSASAMLHNKKTKRWLGRLAIFLINLNFEVPSQAMTQPELKPLKPYGSMQMWYYRVERNFRYPIPTDFEFAYIDKTGNVVVTGPFCVANDFNKGVAVVSVGAYNLSQGKWQLPDLDPQSGSPALVDAVSGKINQCPGRIGSKFYDDLALVKVEVNDRNRRDCFKLIDKTGKFYSDQIYEDVKDYSEGLMAFHPDLGREQWGYKDKNDKIVIEPKFFAAAPFSEGLAAVSVQTNHFGAKPHTPEFYHWERYAYIDKTGAIKIPGPFLEARPFTNGLAAVMLDGKWGYIDKTGKSVIPCQYDWAGDFTGDLAPVEKDMLVGYIDKSGKQIIPFKFKDSREFADGLAPATLDARRWGYIDTSGVFKIEPVFQRAFKFNSGRALVYIDTRKDLKPTAKDADMMLQSAMRARDHVQLNESRASCQSIISIAPGSEAAKRAERFLKTSLPDHDISENVHALYMNGMMRAQMQEFAAAEILYDEALSKDPKFFLAYGAKAYLYLEQKKYEEAEKTLKEGFKINPDYARGLWRLSLVYKAQGKTDLAKETLAKARALDPEDPFFTDD